MKNKKPNSFKSFFPEADGPGTFRKRLRMGYPLRAIGVSRGRGFFESIERDNAAEQIKAGRSVAKRLKIKIPIRANNRIVIYQKIGKIFANYCNEFFRGFIKYKKRTSPTKKVDMEVLLKEFDATYQKEELLNHFAEQHTAESIMHDIEYDEKKRAQEVFDDF